MKTLSTVLCIAGLAMITLSGCGGSSSTPASPSTDAERASLKKVTKLGNG